jgi:hypothetical protein
MNRDGIRPGAGATGGQMPGVGGIRRRFLPRFLPVLPTVGTEARTRFALPCDPRPYLRESGAP